MGTAYFRDRNYNDCSGDVIAVVDTDQQFMLLVEDHDTGETLWIDGDSAEWQ